MGQSPLPELRLWRRRSLGRGSRRCGRRFCFSYRSKSDHFGFECAVGILPIRAAGFFVFRDVFHARSVPALGDRSFACDFKHAGLLFTCNSERLRVLIDRGDHSMKRDEARALLGGQSGCWRSSLVR